jgi:hypothetical protein
MCARPLSPRHAQPDWMGGGLVSRQMMHAPSLSEAIFVFKRCLCFGFKESNGRAKKKWPRSPRCQLPKPPAVWIA